uniref:Guanylate kinase-like domain-containing protein n=1 Tax=Heterorhabditis bacteriophora TaxID=37862 RepID=A0A1I7X5N7_HETBA
MSSEGEWTSELNVVIFGSPQKTIMFEKLCQAASKYERHVHYSDIHYLTVDSEGKDVIEFTDPGLARTGGREMAIKKADLAILFYSAFSLSSLHNLKSLREDLERKKHSGRSKFSVYEAK